MSEKQFAEECLAATNAYRIDHQVPPLSYNRALEQVAQQWADILTKTNMWEHNPNALYKGKQLGENIASHWTSNNGNYSGAHAVAQWYNEIDRYDFKTHQGPRTGHFTQLVWKDSKEMGVGRSQSKDGTWIAVANYFPPGNVIGEYPQNVLQSKDGKKSIITHDDGRHRIGPVSRQRQDPAQNVERDITRNMHPLMQAFLRNPKAVLLALQQNKVNLSGSFKNTTTFCKAVRKEVHGDVKTITTTETTTGSNGTTEVKVTEKISRPGQVNKVKVTDTITAPDGKKTTKISESTE